MPVAWCTALAMAAAVPTQLISPIPLDLMGLVCGSSSSRNYASIDLVSALLAMW